MLKCPNCGETHRLYITAVANIEVDGETEYTEDHDGFEWGDESDCTCSQCYREGKVKEFRYAAMS